MTFAFFCAEQFLTTGQEELEPEAIFGLCALHENRINHFYCYAHNTLCCRACTEETHSPQANCLIVDCYDLRPREINDILMKIEAANMQSLPVRSPFGDPSDNPF